MARGLFGGPLRRFVNIFNNAVLAVADSPRWGRLVNGQVAPITYTGRKSGRSFTLPIGYRLAGDTVTIRVMMPGQKTWWRNFLGAGAPMTIRLDGAERPGHAVARRSASGDVSVTVKLDG